MPGWSKRIPFKVDIAGIIEIMGTSLYSRPDTPIRELLQNAHDAILRRRSKDLNYQGRIDLEQSPSDHTLRFHDDGIGLSAEEAETYLSTLGVGITGLLKKEREGPTPPGLGGNLIGQFGIGLFSAFMLASRLTVESLRVDLAPSEGIRWQAGSSSDIELSYCEREHPGTSVILHLKPEHWALAEQPEILEKAVKEFADFLPVPIFLNGEKRRLNVIHAACFDATPDPEAVELQLGEQFGETPLDILVLRQEKPVALAGALYITPERTPGFSGDPVVTVTVRKMVISHQIRGLLPPWASFWRGLLELNDCTPTASREDLVRDQAFAQVSMALEEQLFTHLERLTQDDKTRLESILAWHRYTLVGAALQNRRLRNLLRECYRLPTSRGLLTLGEIFEQSPADPLLETEVDHVVWYNSDRRQERWLNSLFAGQDVPCVHAVRSFEESLLAALVSDLNEAGIHTDLRPAGPQSPHFAALVLGIQDLEESSAEWQEFLSIGGAKILYATCRANQPVLAFLNERSELARTFEDLRKEGTVSAGFQRMIDRHFADRPAGTHEVILNRNHRLVARALIKTTSHPLASILRLLVIQALQAAGAALDRQAQRLQVDDLDWIAEALWGKDS